jgi:hypothetical protein
MDPQRDQILPLELLSFCISAAMSATVNPDTFALEFMNADIAVARPLVPELEAIMAIPIMAPIPMEIWLAPRLPSIIASDASFIMAVTSAEETGMLMFLADCDMAASVMP